ncbi:putative MFS monocarboxylate transporter [Hypoxylon sp. FL0890]|nr:putative MFS monocarboxylate transporter [Hypoxylon sp. FL0890]
MDVSPCQTENILKNEVIPSDQSSSQNEDKAEIAEVVVSDRDVPPDGGLVQVVGGFAFLFNTWGIINTFGVFQTYYETDLLRHMSPSAISWIGSLQSFLLLAVGVIQRPALRCWIPAASSMFWSGVGDVWHDDDQHLQGILAGNASAGCVHWYRDRVSVHPVCCHHTTQLRWCYLPSHISRLITRVGVGWATRIMGFTSLATISISLVVLRRRIAAIEIRSLLDLQAFREPSYVFYCIGICLSYIAFFVPIFYLQTYALSHGLEGQPVALYLVAVLNAAESYRPVHTFFISIILAAVTEFAWINTNLGPGNIAFAAFFGFFTGSIVALPAVVLTSFTSDLGRLGTRLCMSSVFNGLASLIGAPIGGAILGATGNWLGDSLFAGFLFVGTAVFIAALRFALTGKKLVVRA